MNLTPFRSREPGRALLGALMLGVGILHFTHATLFAAIVPDYLPAHLLLVYVSGVAEMALGVLLWVSRTRVWAAWGLIALYVAVFPANVNMALHPDLPLPGVEQPPSPLSLWLRLPLQLVLIYWAYRYTRAQQPPAEPNLKAPSYGRRHPPFEPGGTRTRAERRA